MTLAIIEPDIKPNRTDIPYISRVERLPSLKPGEPRLKIARDHLSPSAIKKYQRCQASYWFHYGEGLREGSDSSLIRGTAIHEGAHAYAYCKREALRSGSDSNATRLLAMAHDYADECITRELAYAHASHLPLEWKPPYKGAKTVMTEQLLRGQVRDAITLLAERSWQKIEPVALEVGYLIYWQDETDPDPAKRTLPVLAFADRIEEH